MRFSATTPTNHSGRRDSDRKRPLAFNSLEKRLFPVNDITLCIDTDFSERAANPAGLHGVPNLAKGFLVRLTGFGDLELLETVFAAARAGN